MSRLITVVFFVLCNGLCFSQSPPQIVASGNQFFCGESPMPIVTDISISDGEGVLDVVYVQIATGYTFGSDVLFLDGVHQGITSFWSYDEGLLTLTGPATYDEFEDAIRDVKYQTIESNFTQDKFFSINLGEANFLPSTGHYYFYAADLGISWSEAKTAAANQTYFGLQGYLATITSEEEVQLTGEQAQGTGWIGASDQASEGIWRWETGPEEGQVFWEGQSDGSEVNGMFSFWNTGEPNNFGGEHYAHVTDPNIGVLGSWNDLPNAGDITSGETGPYYPKGYIVEFGGMPGDPEINVSASTVIITPKLEITTNSICGQGMAQITLITNTDDVLWYETESSADVINSGFFFDNYIEATTTYYALPLFNGCEDQSRIPITVEVFDAPIANSITIMQCDDETADGISTFNLYNYTDDILQDSNGQIGSSLKVVFFEDEFFKNEIITNNYINASNNQIVYAQVLDEFSGCISTSEVTLQVNSSTGNFANLEVCDDFVIDGFTFFDLTEADDQILENAPINAELSYYLSYSNALLEVDEIIGEYFNEEAYEQTIYCRINIGNSCYAINEVFLTVRDLPNVNQYEEVYYCLNSFPKAIVLDGGIINDIPNNYTYNWSTGESTINIEINEVGTYEVLVTQPGACTNKRTIVVKPSSLAIIEMIEISDFSGNNTITALVSGEGNYVYALDDENGSYQESNIFENVSPGIHTVYIKDVKANCGVVYEAISVLGFPKFFTPNGDGVNDTWQLSGFSSQFPITAVVEIFDRYGKLLTVIDKDNPKWDGTFNGSLLSTDDYWFAVKLKDGRTFKGHFTLKR